MTKGVRQRMKDVQNQMNQQQTTQQKSTKKHLDGEFIDYEEVK